MAEFNPKNPEISYREAEELDDQLAQVRAHENIPTPSLTEMKDLAEKRHQEAEKIEKKKQWADDSDDEPGDRATADEDKDTEALDRLMRYTPRNPERGRASLARRNRGRSGHDKSSHTAPGGEKPEVIVEDEPTGDPEDDNYAESFASHRETSQLREDMESLRGKIEGIEITLKLLMEERRNLPSQLDTIQANINSQMTLMLDKLQAGLESNDAASAVQAASLTVEQAKDEAKDQLKAASSHLSADPSPNSPLSAPGRSLAGKRKFKAIK